MKFSPFVYDYIVSDDWEFLENMTGYNDPKEYFGFELPFTEKTYGMRIGKSLEIILRIGYTNISSMS